MEEDYSRESRPAGGDAHRQASTGELMQSAKLVAGAAQSAYGGGAGGVDKHKVAGAAEDLLDAAQKYGKLDESAGAGQYIEKAEGYLHKYHASGGGGETAGDRLEGGEAGGDYRGGGESGGGRREGRENVGDDRRGDTAGDYREGGEAGGDYRGGGESGGGRREGRENVGDDRRGDNAGDYREGGETAGDRREEEEGRSGGGGVGQYVNMAKGFLK